MSSKSTSSKKSVNSLSSTQVETPKPKWMFGISPISSTSSTNRCCRICQMSEDGISMVRPCDCSGTVGDVHVECLTKWVNMSGKKDCEICKATYAKSGEVFKPIRKWTRPTHIFSSLYSILLFIAFILLSLYLVFLMNERCFYDRIINQKMFWRPDDTGRACVLAILVTTALINLLAIAADFIKYLKSQREIRFINKHE
ncbi:unnamed protein product [Caenorhabditis angaria]|uniref:RING-CH-type domain-containing protein n=1 Tax=Caenorhabditis angaria TaxID=860376 RepID=A0A9P1N695_9PELO|nr:unnamed protein product [Caenorhabditis angaria]